MTFKSKDYNQGTISDTGNWNVADKFSLVKIMTPIENSEIYEDVARYGFDSFFEELIYQGVSVSELKLKGLFRLTDELIKLCKNSKFAMIKKGTLEMITDYQTKLEQIKKDILPHVFYEKRDMSNNTRVVILNEKIFNLALEKISEIKSEINKPLNKNSLIFVDREEFDPADFKARIKERMINKG